MTTYICFGYTCSCGEKVTVLRFRSDEANQLPARKVVACKNGHTAVCTATELEWLDSWAEEAEDGAGAA
jgi:hypothetical protein